jgi:hypothetical protein
MRTKIKKLLQFLAFYIVQAGTLWGLLDGYTYFKGDDLKNSLGSYWVLIYILPVFTAAYFTMQGTKKEDAVQESITTQGDFSPGKVGGDYSVQMQPDDPALPSSSSEIPDENLKGASNKAPGQTVRTQGNYSPGKVEGDYKVEG